MQRSIPLGGRYRQISLYCGDLYVHFKGVCLNENILTLVGVGREYAERNGPLRLSLLPWILVSSGHNLYWQYTLLTVYGTRFRVFHRMDYNYPMPRNGWKYNYDLCFLQYSARKGLTTDIYLITIIECRVVVSIHSVMHGYVVFIDSLCTGSITLISYRLGMHLCKLSLAMANMSKW